MLFNTNWKIYFLRVFEKKITDRLGIGSQINKQNPVRLYTRNQDLQQLSY